MSDAALFSPPGDRPPLDLPPFEAVSLDVGGVLSVPDHGILGVVLRRAGVSHDPGRFWEGHYRAMAEVDRCLSDPEEFADYARGFLLGAGVPDGQLEAGAAALAPVLVSQLWVQRVPGSTAAACRLAEGGLRLAVTSNADGTIEDMMRRHELAQVGDGHGVPVEHITDSGVIGAAKPDPAMFHATADALGLPPGRICHIGDSGYYDARGARAIGMAAVHVDPLGLCPDDDHPHVASLVDFTARVLADRAGTGG